MQFLLIMLSIFTVTSLDYRARITYLKDFRVGNEYADAGLTFENRFRLNYERKFKDIYTFRFKGDLMAGLVLGEEPNVYTEYSHDPRYMDKIFPSWIDLREVSIERFTRRWILRIGHEGSKWGLGIVANDGSVENIWGDDYIGDIVERAMVILPVKEKPLTLFGLALDFPFRDSFGGLYYGDLPLQGIFLFMMRGKDWEAGIYIVQRYQEFDEGGMLNGRAYDLYFKWMNSRVTISGEGALMEGRTDYLRSYSAPKGVNVLSGGGVIRGDVKFGRHFIRVEGGVATGDQNPFDKKLTQFSFNPDYNVGIVLFEEVRALISLADSGRVANPQIAGSPAPGVRLIPTNGGVSNCIYGTISGIIRPYESGTLKVGYIWARAVVRPIDMFRTFENGGVPTNYLGRPYPGLEYGHEFDLGFSHNFALRSGELTAGFEYGILITGNAFKDEFGNRQSTISKFQGRLGLKW